MNDKSVKFSSRKKVDMYVYIHIAWGIYLPSIVSCGVELGTQLRVLSGSFNFVVSSYQSRKYGPILTTSVRSMDIDL